MTRTNPRLLFYSALIFATIAWFGFRVSESGKVSSWCQTNSQLVSEIVESIENFIAEPQDDEERAVALLKAYSAWHEFTQSDYIDNCKMTLADEKLLKENAKELSAAQERYMQAVRRRTERSDFSGNKEIYDRIHRIQSTNPYRKKEGP